MSLCKHEDIGDAFSVTNTMNTKFSTSSSPRIAALSDGTVVAVGQIGDAWTLKRFNMKERREVFSEKIKDKHCGLAEISLGGKPVIALSYM